MMAGYERAAMPYPKDMLELIREARRERVRNRTREHERDRRGLLSKSALRKANKGPPARVLVRMSEWEKKADKVSRGVSEVGYIAMVKAQLGKKLKDPNHWKELEEGKAEDRVRLDALYNQVIRENAKRNDGELNSKTPPMTDN